MSERRPIQNLINGLHDRGLYPIAKEIAQQHSVTVEEILGTRRTSQFVKARHAIIKLLCVERGMSANFVGQILGLDHTTVLAARKGVAK